MEKGCEDCQKNSNNSFYNEVLEKIQKRSKLAAVDWLSHINDFSSQSDIVEVRFKNTNKSFYLNKDGLDLRKGDVVAVEADPGHNIGIVSLTGQLAEKQFERKISSKEKFEWKKIFRKADKKDFERWKNAINRESTIRTRAREIIREFNLNMKLSDVEVQGDNSKAIFYYIAEGRVDFRKLIKQFAREFNVRVEMKQIGARQEAGLVGGIGSCGRELCCALWRTDFETIKINQAKIQNLPANAQKLAGQCAKLKCCLMYELDSYLEAWEDFPRELLQLETDSGTYYPQKTDVLKKEILYSRSSETISQPLTLSIKRVKEINYQNKRGQKPSLTPDINLDSGEEQFSIGQSDISAYKSKKRKKTKRNKRNHRKNSRKNRP